ncbi:ATP synthase F1, epsilon subunit [Hydrogenobacter thermophilus TK-6]|uniref:ATP synthase epsilon chain n=1 Tax=Hydrogenobacter thermophilus (strain DSM 6534 / IAM 12695 / TK-6) TaxID=608538 RepID=D3DI84_HYDTT|nr:ATP synthase F1 subunit epsilon [Hydrogenobacter thermophilus]ADO45465.1 ATP synthase F1, epsilon subunit [Hydrogenobacter thermophilus TK-6]BAI69536.1 ATP synthase F1 epsilon subunit [Hydrogenobacter thermophilus TK-6]
MVSVEIVTPQGVVFSRQVNSVNIPTQEGEIGVLERHMYLMTLLKPGLIYFDGNQKDGIAVTYGFVDITPERVIILAEEAYTVGEIDAGKEKELFDQAVKKLATAQTMEEMQEWERVRDRARTLLEILERFGS